MPSHLDEEGNGNEIPEWVEVSDVDIAGNSQADKLARIAAKRACVPLNVSAPVLYYKSLVRRIQNRLATIVQNLPGRPKHVKEPVYNKRESLESLMGSASQIRRLGFLRKQNLLR